MFPRMSTRYLDQDHYNLLKRKFSKCLKDETKDLDNIYFLENPWCEGARCKSIQGWSTFKFRGNDQILQINKGSIVTLIGKHV